jgi:hypothetical protein
VSFLHGSLDFASMKRAFNERNETESKGFSNQMAIFYPRAKLQGFTFYFVVLLLLVVVLVVVVRIDVSQIKAF